MPSLAEVIHELDRLAPLRLAEPWDNVGLLLGDPATPVSRVLFTIDLTLPVLAEAASRRCELILAYHPPIFEPLKRLLPGNIAFEAARRGIAVYSPHTALDAAAGGTNDTLAAALGLTHVRPLRLTPLPNNPPKHVKLVTYVPPDHADAVANALFDAGAGHIGNYSHCSFRATGTGTFLGQPGTHPAIGTPGQLESTPELRLETILPAHRLPTVVAALRAAHPYEEPAFDLIPLLEPPPIFPSPAPAPATSPTSSPHHATEPHAGVGMGRIGLVPVPLTLADLIARLKSALDMPHLLVGSPAQGLSAPVTSVAICAGAGRSLLPEVLAARPSVYLTGELPHHDALKLTQADIAPILTLHSNSERPALGTLADQLQARLPSLTTLLADADHDPLQIT